MSSLNHPYRLVTPGDRLGKVSGKVCAAVLHSAEVAEERCAGGAEDPQVQVVASAAARRQDVGAQAAPTDGADRTRVAR